MPHKHAPAHGVPDHDWGSTTEARIPDDAEREALELLGYGSKGRLIRLSQREWRQVSRVVAAIAAARGAA